MNRHKISLEELGTVLSDHCTARYRPYAGALVSFARRTSAEEGTGLVACRWAFADEPEPTRATLTYPTLVFEEHWLPAEKAVSELLRVLRGEAGLGGCMVPEPIRELEELDSSRDSFTGWRETAFEASITRGYLSDHAPVVGKGLLPYPSLALAVNDFVWRQRHGARDFTSVFDLRKLRILLPDTRARIREAIWEQSTLLLRSDRNADSHDVELQAVTVDRRTARNLGSQAVEPEVSWEIPGDADAIEVFLVHRDGTLLSHRKLTRGQHYSARPGDFVLRERAEEELRQGEGERVEYKPFVEAGNAKEQQLLRTIVAFSNTFGGRIYVGVEDDGTPQSEAELRKQGKGDAKASLKQVMRHLEKLAREKIKPVPDVRVSPIAVWGHSIVVVDVVAGEDAPYSTFDHDMYIRKGASNRKPDPNTELTWIIERARERRERRARQEQYDAMAASSYQKGDD